MGGHLCVILTAGGESLGHEDCPKQGAMSCRQGEEVGKLWKAGTHGDVSLSDEVVEPRLSLQPESPVEACRAAWMGGDFISNAEPQSNQTFCQSNECILGTHVM